jgi:hypothetical protein
MQVRMIRVCCSEHQEAIPANKRFIDKLQHGRGLAAAELPTTGGAVPPARAPAGRAARAQLLAVDLAFGSCNPNEHL